MASIILQDGYEIDAEVNEDLEEAQRALKDPIIFENKTEFEEDDLKKAMKAEMRSMDDFDVADDVPIEQCTQEQVNGAHTLL